MSLALIHHIGDQLAHVPGVYLAVVDSDNVVRYCSQGPCGWTIPEVTGIEATSRVVVRDKVAVRNGLKLAHLGDTSEFQCRLLGPEGACLLDCSARPVTKTKVLVVSQLAREKPKLSLADKIECAVLAALVQSKCAMQIGEVQRSVQNFGVECSRSTLKHVLAGMVRRQLLTSGRGKNAGYAIASGGACR